jgi:hypothetical protein
MVSAIDRCKRALITLIRNLAIAYGSTVAVDRESSDVVVKKAYKKLSLKVHPDPAAAGPTPTISTNSPRTLEAMGRQPEPVGEGIRGARSAAPFR